MQHKWFGAIDLSFVHYSPSSPRFQYRLGRYNEIKQALLNAMLFLGEIKVWRSAGFSFFTANSRYRTVGFTLVTDPVSPLSMRWVQDLSNRLCPMVHGITQSVLPAAATAGNTARFSHSEYASWTVTLGRTILAV